MPDSDVNSSSSSSSSLSDSLFGKNIFFRDQYRRIIKFALFLSVIGAVLVVLIVVLLLTRQGSKYYASTTTGEVIQIQSLSSPVVTQTFLLGWAKTVARQAYNINFVYYQDQLNKLSGFFTKEGWNAFNNAINNSGLLSDIIAKKLYLSSIVNGPAVVVDRFVSGGRFTWMVQMPLLVTFTSASMSVKSQFYINMKIQRVPELETVRGISVVDFSVNGAMNVQ